MTDVDDGEGQLVRRAQASCAALDHVERGAWSGATVLAAAYLREQLSAWLRARGVAIPPSGIGRVGSSPPAIDVAAVRAREADHVGVPSSTVGEIARDVLVFVPIGLTWWHLADAFSGYSSYVRDQTAANTEAVSFLVAWQRGETSSTSFSMVAYQVVAAVAAVAVVALAAAAHRRKVEQRARREISDLVEVLDEAQVVLAWIRSGQADGTAEATRRAAAALASSDQAISAAVAQMATAAASIEIAATGFTAEVADVRAAASTIVDRTNIESGAVLASTAAASSAADAAGSATRAAEVTESLGPIIQDMIIDWQETRRLELERLQEINSGIGDFGRLLEAVDALASRIAHLHPDLYTCRRCSALLEGDGSPGTNGDRVAEGDPP